LADDDKIDPHMLWIRIQMKSEKRQLESRERQGEQVKTDCGSYLDNTWLLFLQFSPLILGKFRSGPELGLLKFGYESGKLCTASLKRLSDSWHLLWLARA